MRILPSNISSATLARVLSFVLHGSVLGIFFFSLPKPEHKSISYPTQVFEIQTMPVQKPQERERPKRAPAPKPKPQPQPVAKPDPQPQAPPAKKEVSVPKPKLQPPAPKPKPRPKPKPKLTPTPKQAKKAPPPKEQTPPKADKSFAEVLKQAQKKPAQKDFHSLLKSLPRPQSPDVSKEAASSSQQQAIESILTAEELTALQQQIEQCWTPPIGLPSAQELLVTFQVEMSPDAHIQRVEWVGQSGSGHKEAFEIMANSAKRALMHPDCQPLVLPLKKYEAWKTFKISFNPRGTG